jgi:hypothetical protein
MEDGALACERHSYVIFQGKMSQHDDGFRLVVRCLEFEWSGKRGLEALLGLNAIVAFDEKARCSGAVFDLDLVAGEQNGEFFRCGGRALGTGAVFEIARTRRDLDVFFLVQAVETYGDGGLGEGGRGKNKKER